MGRPQTSLEVRKIMDCLRSSEQIPMDELVPSPESPATKDYISSVHSSRAGEAGQKPDTGNIEGAESSLRESGCLNYEEARALLGRYEYQKGNLEAALLVFEGIDIALVTPNLKLALAERVKTQKRRSQSFSKPTLSIHAVSVLLEAVFLKAKFLQALQRYKVKFSTRLVREDCPSILDHLSYALSISSRLKTLASKVEELLPIIIDRQEMYLILTLCYYGGGDDFTALNLLQKLLSSTEDHACILGLLLASKVCAEIPDCASEGIIYAQRAIESLQEQCSELLGVANYVLGLSLTAHSRTILTDSERVKIHADALKSFESAGKLTKMSSEKKLQIGGRSQSCKGFASKITMLKNEKSPTVVVNEICGLLNQSKGLYKAALEDYSNALAVYPSHVSSLVSSAVVLRKIGKQSPAIIRSLLTEALRLDRMNASAWCNLRLL
ncbi:putative tetratricopeptide repeat protein 7A-like isoform X2 [Capsicum annuum]|nr:putative tetratricopeptide repeat protein 7A-like isoform X2 [Capsicum annuum]